MNNLDLFIIVFALIFIIIGFIKGFFKQLLSFANWLLAIFIAFISMKPVLSFLKGTIIENKINAKVINWLSSKGEIYTIPISSENPEAAKNAIDSLNLPEFIDNIIIKSISNNSGKSLADIVASIVLSIIVFIFIFIVSLIIIKIIINLLNKVVDIGILGFINRILGASLGLVKATVFVSLVFLAAGFLAGLIPSINNFVTKQLGDPNSGFSISRYIYDNNPLKWFIKMYFK